MKQLFVIMSIVAGLCLTCMSQPAPLSRVKVLKDNCNLRAKALVTSEVVGQVSENDVLTAKSMDKDWVEVVPPDSVDLWVLGDYVKDGVINCSQKVNVRAGAGINFNIVGQLPQGSKIEVRGNHAEWVKIAPPPSCSLWISRVLVSEIPLAYIEPAKVEPPKADAAKVASVKIEPVKTEPAKIEPVKPEPAKPEKTKAETVKAIVPPSSAVAVVSSAQPAVEVKPPAPLPKPADAIAPVQVQARTGAFMPPVGLDLVAGTEQGRWRDVDGLLRPKDFIFRAPSDFRLVTPEGGDRNSTTICFVKGNQAQLEALMYRHLIVSGREYWVKRQKYPVLVPERIVLK